MLNVETANGRTETLQRETDKLCLDLQVCHST
jgi:hypothetical protein